MPKCIFIFLSPSSEQVPLRWKLLSVSKVPMEEEKKGFRILIVGSLNKLATSLVFLLKHLGASQVPGLSLSEVAK